jgi:hypothetical protein
MGTARRMFMARTAQALGKGGQRLAERELGWIRGTVCKGMHEVEQGMIRVDASSSRGRKHSEKHLQNLLNYLNEPVILFDDIVEIFDWSEFTTHWNGSRCVALHLDIRLVDAQGIRRRFQIRAASSVHCCLLVIL